MRALQARCVSKLASFASLTCSRPDLSIDELQGPTPQRVLRWLRLSNIWTHCVGDEQVVALKLLSKSLANVENEDNKAFECRVFGWPPPANMNNGNPKRKRAEV